MVCCGEERSTPFCPFCGKDLREGLWQLLAYLKLTANNKRGTAEKQAKRMAGGASGGSGGSADDHLRKKQKGNDQAATKFAAWAAELETMLKRNGVAHGPKQEG